MNRRRFIQSVVAVLSLPTGPALTFRQATAAVPAAVTVPAHARSWAVYMSVLHGECTPQALKNLLNIPETEAKRYVAQLITEGALKPNPLLQKTLSEFARSREKGLLDKVKQRLKIKENNEQAAPDKLASSETSVENDARNFEADTSPCPHEGPREDLLEEEDEESAILIPGKEVQQI